MTREELLSKDRRQGLIESLRQAKMDKHAAFLFQNCLEEDARGWTTPMLQQQELMRCFQMIGADASPQHRVSIRQTEAHRRRRESMSKHTAKTKRGCNAHCTPTCSILQTGTRFGRL